MIFTGNHDGCLEVPESHDVVAGFGILGDVDDVVFETGLVEGAVGGIALNASGREGGRGGI